MLKVLFAGTPDVAVPSLKLLAQDTEHFEVVAVLTRPDAPTGRGRKLVANPVKQAASNSVCRSSNPIRARKRSCPSLRPPATGRRCGGVRQDPETGRARRAADGLVQPAFLPAAPMAWRRSGATFHLGRRKGDWCHGFPHCARHGCRSDSGAIHRGNRAHETAGELLSVLLKMDHACLRHRCRPWPTIRSLRWSSLPAHMRWLRRSPLKTRISASTCRYSPPTARFAHARRIRDWCELHAHADANRRPCTYCARSRPTCPIRTHRHRLNPAISWPQEERVGRHLHPSRSSCWKLKAQGKKAMRAADWARGAHLDNAFCE